MKNFILIEPTVDIRIRIRGCQNSHIRIRIRGCGKSDIRPITTYNTFFGLRAYLKKGENRFLPSPSCA